MKACAIVILIVFIYAQMDPISATLPSQGLHIMLFEARIKHWQHNGCRVAIDAFEKHFSELRYRFAHFASSFYC